VPIRFSYAQTIGQDRLPGWGQSKYIPCPFKGQHHHVCPQSKVEIWRKLLKYLLEQHYGLIITVNSLLARFVVEQVSRFKSLTPEQRQLLLRATKALGKYTEGVVLSPRVEVLLRVVSAALWLALGMAEKHERQSECGLCGSLGVVSWRRLCGCLKKIFSEADLYCPYLIWYLCYSKGKQIV